MTIAQAQRVLTPFTCQGCQPLLSLEDFQRIRAAVLQLAAETDTHIFGVLADSLEDAIAALQSYCVALGYTPPRDVPPCEGAVYVKFNARSGLCYVNPYPDAAYRGVLLAFQSDFVDGVNELYGHLPLDLFRV